MQSSCPECGTILVKPRSSADHRRFFGLIHAAFHQWPEAHTFQPTDAEHLRAWLLFRAGYHDVSFVEVDPEFAADPDAMASIKLAVEASLAAVAQKGGYAFVRVSAAGLEILSAKSINFATLGQKEFGQIRQAVEEILEAALGVSAEQLLREKAA